MITTKQAVINHEDTPTLFKSQNAHAMLDNRGGRRWSEEKNRNREDCAGVEWKIPPLTWPLVEPSPCSSHWKLPWLLCTPFPDWIRIYPDDKPKLEPMLTRNGPNGPICVQVIERAFSETDNAERGYHDGKVHEETRLRIGEFKVWPFCGNSVRAALAREWPHQSSCERSRLPSSRGLLALPDPNR